MMRVYHPGEIQIQERAGSRALAATMERTVLPVIAHKFIDFIQSQPFLVLATVDDQGKTWASMLSGKPGFLAVVNEQTLHIDALPDEGDPLHNNLQDERDIGLLLIDFVTRRRLRVNGSLKRETNGFSVQAKQVYANCPRYIQAREWEWTTGGNHEKLDLQNFLVLNDVHQQWIRQADTFFIASCHPDGGADVSHRGGFSGFVQVVDKKNLVWPEYNGNGMFNTLGNILVNHRVGLLFVDFDKGGTLQLTGSATIVWDEEHVSAFPGAERLVEFKLDHALAGAHAETLCWRFMNYSPDNPWYC